MSPGMWTWCCCIPPGGNTAISWIDSLNNCIRVAELYGGEWRFEKAVDLSSLPYNAGICYDSAGALHILFRDNGKLYWGKRTAYGSAYTITEVATPIVIAEDQYTATLITEPTVTVIYQAGVALPYDLTAAVWNGVSFTKTTQSFRRTYSNAVRYAGKIYVFGLDAAGTAKCFEWDGAAWTALTGENTVSHITTCATGLMWVNKSGDSSYVRYGFPASYQPTAVLNAGSPDYINRREQAYELTDGTITWTGGYGNIGHTTNTPAVHHWDGLSWTPTWGGRAAPTTYDSLPVIFSRVTAAGSVHQTYTSAGDCIYYYEMPGGNHAYTTVSAPPVYNGTDTVQANSTRLAVQGSINQYESL